MITEGSIIKVWVLALVGAFATYYTSVSKIQFANSVDPHIPSGVAMAFMLVIALTVTSDWSEQQGGKERPSRL